MAEQAAGSSSFTAHDAALQRAAATDGAGASLEPKHDHARGAGREPEKEQAAGPSGGAAYDSALQPTAMTDSAGASLEPKHDGARGAGRESMAE
jgi:hypothetical protein